MRRLHTPAIGAWIVLMALTVVVPGDSVADDGFAAWLEELRREASALDIRAETLDRALSGIRPLAEVIEQDRKQPEFTMTFRTYLKRVVSDSKVRRGREALRRHREELDAIAARYGVQRRFLVALWGIESDYGRLQGRYPVIASLATLAHDGRRARFFRGELLDALRILDEERMDPQTMLGSWSGAMGQPQFMPSSFRRHAVDGDGDGRRDIWNSPVDALASAANYLAQNGWNDDLTWGRRVRLPGGFDTDLAGRRTSKSLAQWQALGVRRADGSALPRRDLQASLVLPDGPGGPAYLTYSNFGTLLKWNRSDYFAIAVGTLSDRLE